MTGYRDANFRGLRVVGWTTDGRPVLAGLFPVVNSEGVSLDVLLDLLHVCGWVVDWPDFLRAAQAFGWKPHNTLVKIHAALAAIEGTEHADAWKQRAATFLAQQTKDAP